MPRKPRAAAPTAATDNVTDLQRDLPRVGIAITTHNRNEQINQMLTHLISVTPSDFPIIVVDDGSNDPVNLTVSDAKVFRFEKNVGIAAAKNKCFELLMDLGVDHLFLFDDDCWPKVPDWWKAYTESPEPHLAYIFAEYPAEHERRLNDTIEISRDDSHVAWSHQRGCMLYYKRVVLDTVGGMDWAFGAWGYEHGSLADRIFNAGLTTHRYMDVIGSDQLIHSMDEHLEIGSTCSNAMRAEQIKRNSEHHRSSRNSAAYIDYRQRSKTNAITDVVITSYFTGQRDPERGETWSADYDKLDPLISSIKRGVQLVIIHDCFSDEDAQDSHFIKHIRVPPIAISPYFARWIYARQYIGRHPEIARVWCVDATDVVMINSPFEEMQPGLLYTGDEPSILASPWMLSKHPAEWLQSFMRSSAPEVLLNAGLLGGERQTVLRFLSHLVGLWEDNKKDLHYGKSKSVGESDMALFNFVARQHFKSAIKHGRQVNTVFKRFQCTQNVKSWWRHK